MYVMKIQALCLKVNNTLTASSQLWHKTTTPIHGVYSGQLK